MAEFKLPVLPDVTVPVPPKKWSDSGFQNMLNKLHHRINEKMVAGKDCLLIFKAEKISEKQMETLRVIASGRYQLVQDNGYVYLYWGPPGEFRKRSNARKTQPVEPVEPVEPIEPVEPVEN